MNIKEYKDNLLNFDLKSFLKEYSVNDIFRIKDLYPDNYKLLAEQIKLYPKAVEKLPVFSSNYCFFTTKSYEQASSETTAEYKAKLFKGKTLIDLTGGLGVDDWAFAKSFNKVISIDNDANLNKLVMTNFRKLKLENIQRIDADANEFIKQNLWADLIYIDADRRTNSGKSLTLHTSEPNVLNIIQRLKEISDNQLLKLSPITDITYISKSLDNVANIYIISYENDVKEILAHITNNFTGKIKIKAVNILKSKQTEEFSGYANNRQYPIISTKGKYFYEPSNSLIKSGLVNEYAVQNDLYALSRNCAYLLSNIQKKEFFGRSFVILAAARFSNSKFKRYLSEHRLYKANISARNFGISTDNIKKLFNIADGGNDYLFFAQDDKRQKLFYHCIKAKVTEC